MAKNVSIDNFANEVINEMKNYTEEVQEAIFDDVKGTAEFAADWLKNLRQPDASESGTASPSTRRIWKTYSKGWKVNVKEGMNFIHVVIHNASKHYRLTHLLEYGHATRNGTRTRAFRHIEPMEKYCTETIEKDIPKIIKKGGKI